MPEKLVTIITPTYNHGNYIGQCIESVLSQTYTEWEQIIIDDGSTDNTAEVIAQYSDPRIKYIHQNNIGIWRLKDTYNKALAVAQGELIAILEGDDFWPPDKLEKQIPAFNCEDVTLSCGKGAIVNSMGNTMAVFPKDINFLSSLSYKNAFRELILCNYIMACTVICRKDILNHIGGFQQPASIPYVDYPTWLELSLHGNIVIFNECLGYWRRHDQQITNMLSVNMANGKKYSIDFFKNLPDHLKKSLNITISELEHNYKIRLGDGWIVSGRNSLIQRNWKQARIDFNMALKIGTPFIKAEALLGIICSWLKMDVEWMVKIIKKSSIRD